MSAGLDKINMEPLREGIEWTNKNLGFSCRNCNTWVWLEQLRQLSLQSQLSLFQLATT